MKLTRIQINEFFNLQKIDIDLSPGHALILGPNGTGKSKIFKCVQFLVEQSIFCLDQKHSKTLIWNDCERIWNLNADSCYIKLDFTLSDKEMNFLRTFRIIRLIYHIDDLLHKLKMDMGNKMKVVKSSAEIREPRPWKIMARDDPSYFDDRAEDYKDTEDMEKFASSPECKILNTLINSLESLCNELHNVHEKILKNASLRLGCDVAAHNKERALVTHPQLIFDSRDDSNHLDLLSGEEISVLNRFLEDFGGDLKTSLQDEAHELIKEISSNKYLSFSIPSISQGGLQGLAKKHSFLHERIRSLGTNPLPLAKCLKQWLAKSVCFLPQLRGLQSKDRKAAEITYDTLRRKLIEAKLSSEQEDRKRFENVDNGMKGMCGISLFLIASTKESGNDSRPIRDIAETTSDDPFHICLRFVKETGALKSPEMSLSHCSGGELEVLLVLAAVFVSGAQTVFLDEPGHSLHPPQQAQLRHYLEEHRPEDQGCVIITHSMEFLSEDGLKNLYRTYCLHEGANSAARLREMRGGLENEQGCLKHKLPESVLQKVRKNAEGYMHGTKLDGNHQTEDHLEKLNNQLQELTLRQYDVLGDRGKSLYRSVAHQLYGYPEKGKDIQKRVEKENWEAYMLDQEIQLVANCGGEVPLNIYVLNGSKIFVFHSQKPDPRGQDVVLSYIRKAKKKYFTSVVLLRVKVCMFTSGFAAGKGLNVRLKITRSI